jgi:hypothetical protein
MWTLGLTAFCLTAVYLAVVFIPPKTISPDVTDTTTSSDSGTSATSGTPNLTGIKVTHIAETETLPKLSPEDKVKSGIIGGAVTAD